MQMQEEPAFITIPIQTFKDILNEVQSLKDQITALEARHNEDIERLALDIAFDRQRLAKLEKVKPQPLQKDRGEILRALISANGGRMLAKDARQKMHLSKSRFSELLTRMDGDIEKRPYHLDHTQNIIILR
jgi:uncharacterized membrane protein